MKTLVELVLILAITVTFMIRDQWETATERRQWKAMQKLMDNQTLLLLTNRVRVEPQKNECVPNSLRVKYD